MWHVDGIVGLTVRTQRENNWWLNNQNDALKGWMRYLLESYLCQCLNWRSTKICIIERHITTRAWTDMSPLLNWSSCNDLQNVLPISSIVLYVKWMSHSKRLDYVRYHSGTCFGNPAFGVSFSPKLVFPFLPQMALSRRRLPTRIHFSPHNYLQACTTNGRSIGRKAGISLQLVTLLHQPGDDH